MSNPIAVIGLGPAGISAAIQLHRYGLRPRIYEPRKHPGLLRNANLVENYPGFPEGISGPELYELFRRQLDRYSPDIVKETVVNLVAEKDMFVVDSGDSAGRFGYVVIATGTKPRPLDLPHPADRVFYEVADVPEKCEDIVILGGGDAAFDYALNLTGKGKRAVIVCRSERPKCLGLLEERCRTAGIETFLGAGVKAVMGGERMTITLTSGGQLAADAMLCALGREPNLDFLDSDLRQTLDNGLDISGLYLVGDVKNGLKRQVAVAAGDGLRAAMDIKGLIG